MGWGRMGLMETRNRLSKVLAAAGIASRRHAEDLIFQGLVTVNGQCVRIPQTMACPKEDDIRFRGERIMPSVKKIYYILNKPKGTTCSSAKTDGRRLVLDIFPPQDGRLFTVGRLDRDTTGLLIVTNDGHFANSVIHPSANLTKEYVVKTKEEITHEHLTRISKGTFVEDVFVKPKKVVKVRRGTVKITVSEGKKREVRLLAANAGLSVVSLERIRIGGLTLGDIPEGAYREMTPLERAQIFN